MQHRLRVLIIVLLLFLTGCDIQKHPEDLMRAPALTGEMNQLHKAIMNYLPADAQIYIPLNSENAVAIGEVDLNSDGIMEAYATYSLKVNNKTIHGVILLKQSSDSWTKLNQIEINSDELDFIRFADLANDGQLKIMIGSVISTDENKILHIYGNDIQEFRKIAELPYAQMEVGNLNNDPVPEIIILNNNRFEMTADASVYQYDGRAMVLLDKLPLDGSINGYSDVKFGKASSSVNGVFIEAGVGAHSAYSILLIMKDGKLQDVFGTAKPDGGWIPFIPRSTYPEDANHDGIIEIPLLEELTPDASYAEMAFRTVWNKWDGQTGLIPAYYTYDDYGAGYSLTLPNSWKSNLQVSGEHDPFEETTFFYVNERGRKIADLASIRYYDNVLNQEDIERKLQQSKLHYQILGMRYNRLFVGIIPDEASQAANLSPKELEKLKEMRIDLAYLLEHIELTER
ncbi:hypothetical protein E0485_17045 [Paenibacillus albiflavus]|uniref:VCBS repeat-containing protein n=1 Tax=Paenibacillus albiflavus TaxID=2545760 RepID=A0A4R4E8V4_9BACL|nr:hypothetical protein [Paenibacillus albiflavus]TCZ75597.1 hypothetical protein E0485_17045 [Paenibacillus albiflavus]